MGKDALVIPREVLFGDEEFQGFLPLGQRDLVSVILENHSFHPRGDELEKNRDLQQVIPYVWIVNPLEMKAFLYKRAINSSEAEGEFTEERYLHKYSGGVGGHIDRDTEEGVEDPITQAMMRELREEVDMAVYPEPRVIGYINDDSDELGRVHFGIVAIAKTTGSVRVKSSEGLEDGAFYSAEEVDSIFSNPENQVENWTKFSWSFVKDYMMFSQ